MIAAVLGLDGHDSLVVVIVLYAVVLLCLLAAEWVRILVSVYQFFSEQLALASCDSSRPSSPPGEGDLDWPPSTRPHAEPSSAGALLSSPPPARCAARSEDPKILAVVSPAVLAVAQQPDFDAFFGGLEAVISGGGIAVIAVVVVMTIRRLTSF